MWIVAYFYGKNKIEEYFETAEQAFDFATFVRKAGTRVNVSYIRKEKTVEEWL